MLSLNLAWRQRIGDNFDKGGPVVRPLHIFIAQTIRAYYLIILNVLAKTIRLSIKKGTVLC